MLTLKLNQCHLEGSGSHHFSLKWGPEPSFFNKAKAPRTSITVLFKRKQVRRGRNSPMIGNKNQKCATVVWYYRQGGQSNRRAVPLLLPSPPPQCGLAGPKFHLLRQNPFPGSLPQCCPFFWRLPLLNLLLCYFLPGALAAGPGDHPALSISRRITSPRCSVHHVQLHCRTQIYKYILSQIQKSWQDLV